MCHVITIQRAEFYVQRIGLLKIVHKTYYSDLKYSNSVKQVACNFYFLDAVADYNELGQQGRHRLFMHATPQNIFYDKEIL